MPSGSLPASPPGPPPTSSTSASPITPRSTPASLTPIPRYVLGALRLLHATTALARTRLRLMPIPVPPTKSAILMTTIVSRVQEFSLLLSFLADGHPKSARVKTCAGPSGGEAARALEAQAWGGSNGEPPVQGRMFRRMPHLYLARTKCAEHILRIKRLAGRCGYPAYSEVVGCKSRQQKYNKIERSTEDA